MISDDQYRTSTQYRLFSFPSAQALLAKRTKTNAHSRAQLPDETVYLTVEEEVELVDYYVGKLWDLCRLFKVPSHVKVNHLQVSLTQACATSFLLRYYLTETPLTTHPKHMILTALFLSSKTENHFIPIEYFKAQLPVSVDSSQLTSLEFPLSSGIQFSYTVHSCLRPLWGFGLELLALIDEGALDYEKSSVRKIMDEARQWGQESLRTDAQFLYTPPQIALACIFHYNEELVREFLKIKFVAASVSSSVGENDTVRLENGQEDPAERLISVVVACDALITERLEVIQTRSKEDEHLLVKGIDKKLWQCRKVLDAQESSGDTPKRKASSQEEREVKKPKTSE